MRYSFAAGALLLVFACAGHEDGGADMAVQADGMITHAADLEGLTSDHAAGVTKAQTVGAIQGMEHDHAFQMTGHFDRVEHDRMDMMRYCHHRTEGSGPGTAEFGDAMRQMRDECTRHRDAMTAVTDLSAAQTEEERHRTAMGGPVARMRSTAQAMKQTVGWYRCGMHFH
jgi:hypothetical protein